MNNFDQSQKMGKIEECDQQVLIKKKHILSEMHKWHSITIIT